MMEEETNGIERSGIPFLHFAVQLQSTFVADSREIEKRLSHFPRTEAIKAYGINNMGELAINPFS